jgi:hypothetical protein
MKTVLVLLATIIVACTVTSVSARKTNPVPENQAEDYECAMLSVTVPQRARPVGLVQIPSPAANFTAIGLWARYRWHRFLGEPLERQDCVWPADSAEK